MAKSMFDKMMLPASRPLPRVVAAALLPQLCWTVLAQVIGQQNIDHPFTLMLLPVLLAAWWGGMLAGLVATLLGVLSAVDLSTLSTPAMDLGGMRAADFVGAGLYVSLGALISVGLETVRRRSAQLVQAERAVLQSEQRMVEQAPAALAMFDREMRYLACSRKWLTGYQLNDSSSLIGRSHYEVFPEIGPAWKAVHQRALAGETVSQREERFERADGSELYIDWECKPWHTAEGAVGGIIIWSQNVTESVLAREAAKANLQSVVDASPAVLYACRYGGDWGTTFISAKVTDMLGYTPEECLEPGWWVGALHPDDRERVLAGLAELMTHDRHLHEYRMLSKSGQVFWVQDELAVARNAQGEPTHCTGAILNISNRKAAEAALAASRAQLQGVADHAPVLLAQCGLDLHYRFVNKPYAALFGRQPSELFGLHPREVLGEAAFDHAQAYMLRALAGERVEYELSLPDTGDGPRTVWVTYAPNRDDAGAVTGFVAAIRDITARKATQAALRESEVRFRDLWESNRDAQMLLFPPNWCFAEANQAAVALFGARDAEHLAAMNPADTSPEYQPDGQRSQDKMQQVIEQVLREGAAFFEWLHRKPDGTEFLCEVSLTCVTRDGVTGFQGIVRDITERQAAEAALQQFKSTLDATQDCVFMFHPDTLQFFYVNQGALEQVGYTEAELLGIHPYDIKPQFPEPAFRAMVAPLIDGSKPSLRFETLHRHKDGHDVPVEVFLQYITPAGEPPRFVAIVTDITERKVAESAQTLTLANAELATALDAARLGTMVVDLAGETAVWNQRAFEIVGIPEDQRNNPVPRSVFLAHVPSDEHPLIEATFATCVQQGATSVEHSLHWPDGSIRYLVTNARLQRDSAGNPLQILAVLRDVTDEREAEQALTQALTAAQAGDKAKSDFLNVISHEIRTPLNGVMGMLQLIELQNDLGQQGRTYVQEAYKSSQLLLTILNDVLDFGGLQKGRLSVSPTPMRLSQLKAYLQQLQSSLVFGHGVVFTVGGHIEPDVLVLGDELRLKQILLNLVNNAVKFTAHGSVQASVVLRRVDAQQAHVDLIVSDTGLGMSEETQAKLFTPFMQADMSMTRQYGGTGLGLAIIKGLVEEMGGSIDVNSQLGVSSTLTVRLSLNVLDATAAPAAPAFNTQALALQANQDARLAALSRTTEMVAHAQAQQARHQAEPEAPQASLREQVVGALAGVHVLIVEDDIANARVVRTMLEVTGAQVSIANDAFDALDLLYEPDCGIDVVLMDLQMPNMDGFSATRRLRQSEEARLKNLPVIGLSGNIMRGEPKHAISAGMNSFLAKPASLEAMVAAIREALGR